MDFSKGYIHNFHAVVMPLKTRSNMWYFKDPFTYSVWLSIFASIPIYIIAMGMAYYFYGGSADWNMLCGFVIRNALSEQNNSIPHQAKVHQRVLIITWLWSSLVLVQAYAGSLTAMLAKPQFQSPIKNLEELLGQTEIPWVVEKGTPAELYMRAVPAGTTLNLLHNQAELVPPLPRQEKAKGTTINEVHKIFKIFVPPLVWISCIILHTSDICPQKWQLFNPFSSSAQRSFMHVPQYGCYAAKLREKGSVCSLGLIWYMIETDLSTSGKCNFYLIDERITSSMGVAAFQVNGIPK